MSTTTTPASKTTARRTDIYNDPSFNYAQFWSGRDYEHHAEVIALEYLLRGRKFGHAIDIGGGFGRLSVILAGYADRVTLVDPSSQQLALSEQIFPGHPKLERQLMDAANLGFDDETADLVTLIRVLHHLPDPAPELAELARILRPGGLAVIEVANSAHVANRLRYLLRGERVPRTPVDLRSEESRRRGTAPYFNHHPDAILANLAEVGLAPRAVLSVSNLRHPAIKAMVPQRALLAIERATQQPLGKFYFGPSTFFLLQKRDRIRRRTIEDVLPPPIPPVITIPVKDSAPDEVATNS
jgi:SAM-dependent methyltransferase